MKCNIAETIQAVENASREHNTFFFCTTRDVFQARLDTYVAQTQQYLASAVIGEIGNNTFDHNWDYGEGQCRGAYFNPDCDGFIVLADFGRGLRASLSSVKRCASDLEAIKTAFTEHISGRAPEQRGNGLKFVCESVREKGWALYFQSGTAVCVVEAGNVRFEAASTLFNGCLAVLEFLGNNNDCQN